MMKKLLIRSVVVLLSMSLLARGPQDFRAQMGLKGPVHSILIRVEKLAPNPNPHDAKNGLYDLPTNTYVDVGWLGFDSEGRIAETGTVQKDGTIAQVTHVHRDAQGNETERLTEVPGQAPITERTETSRLAGKVETRSYINGALSTRYDTTASAPETKNFETHIYGSDNQVKEQHTYETEGKSRIRTVRGADGEIKSKTIERHANGELERSEYDAMGKLIRTFRVKDGKLTYAWQDPEEKKPGRMATGPDGDGTSYTWLLLPGGQLETWAISHPHSRFFEPDDIQRLDSSGAVMEKLTFSYIRDAHGNWTSRSISAWHASTNATIEIERDTRAITYYDSDQASTQRN